METLSVKEIRFVIEGLNKLCDGMTVRLHDPSISEDTAVEIGDDLEICESLVRLFTKEKEAVLARAQAEAAEDFDLDKIKQEVKRNAEE